MGNLISALRSVRSQPQRPQARSAAISNRLGAEFDLLEGKPETALVRNGHEARRCELCGQGELWRGKKMGLILDHVNGVRDDNRIDNLRIVCPNCAATLDTHCGRKRAGPPLVPRACERCQTTFTPKYRGQRYCSRYCGSRWDRSGVKHPGARKVERPPRDQLLAEIDEHGYLGVGRRYGVSDNAIRKWIRGYQRERAVADGRDPDLIEIPRRTWPNRRLHKNAA